MQIVVLSHIEWLKKLFSGENLVDVAIMSYDFGPRMSPFVHIFCRDQKALTAMQGLIQEADYAGRTEEGYFVLYLYGPVKHWTEELLKRLPLDDSWGYSNFTLENDFDVIEHWLS